MEARGRYRRRAPGEGLSLGGVWTEAEAAKHFSSLYEFENDNPRSGNVSINSELYKCRKYISDSGDDARIYVRIVELAEGTHYKIEQGYPVGDFDGDDNDDSGCPLEGCVGGRSGRSAEAAAQPPPKARSKKAAAAPAAAPPPAAASAAKKRRAK